jgi:hypothetical protein
MEEEQEKTKCSITPQHHVMKGWGRWRVILSFVLRPFYFLPQQGPAFPDKVESLSMVELSR